MRNWNYIRFADNTAVAFADAAPAIVAAKYSHKTPYSAGHLDIGTNLTKGDQKKVVDIYEEHKDELIKYRNEFRASAVKIFNHRLENRIKRVYGPADTLGVGFKDDDADFLIGKKWKVVGGAFLLFEMEPPEVEAQTTETEIQ